MSILNKSFKNNKGEIFYIIDYISSKNVTVQFEDNTILYNRNTSDIFKGKLKNPNTPSKYNRGYIGIGKYKASDNYKKNRYYVIWQAMLNRCYSEKAKERNTTYKNVIVCEEWLNFQNFARWYEENWKPWMDDNWELDKDIICKDCKIYSPDTCCFVPQEINKVIFDLKVNRSVDNVGVVKDKNMYRAQISINGKREIKNFKSEKEANHYYKVVKEDYVKKTADKWKNLISDKVYKSLYLYKVDGV